MRFPIFVSSPSPENLSPEQTASAEIILRLVKRHQLEWRALGRSDYPNDLPLKEVLRMVRHCAGGIILGFEQYRMTAGQVRRGSSRAKTADMSFPTPWNQLEAGILYGAGLPLMIFREPAVEGGVFDEGNTEVFIHEMPTTTMSRRSLGDLNVVFQNWVAKVQQYYYGD
ncbi:hypothetical protein [Paractinoplanes durhamensis]|nr:hypothetical protein [Actinoplanes durhamensis]